MSFEPVWNASVTTVYDTDGHAHFGGAKLEGALDVSVGSQGNLFSAEDGVGITQAR